MDRVRAKFRVISKTVKYDGETFFELLPVYNKKTSQNFEENKAFWEYTPSGKLTVCYAEDVPALKPGAYYYLDLIRLEAKPPEGTDEWWVLDPLTLSTWGAKVNFGLAYHGGFKDRPKGFKRNGQLEMQLSGKATAARTLFASAGEGSLWKLEISFADESDG